MSRGNTNGCSATSTFLATPGAWIILAIYVLMIVGRERRLQREISSLKAMLEERQKK